MINLMKARSKIEWRMVKEFVYKMMDLRLRVFLRMTNYMGLLHRVRVIQQDFTNMKENTLKV